MNNVRFIDVRMMYTESLWLFVDMSNEHGKEQLGDSVNNINSIISEKDVRTVAQKFANDRLVKVLDYSLDDYSSDKLGFLGAHKNLKIRLQRSTGTIPETINFFVKSIPYNIRDQAQFMKKEGIFTKESNFFNIIPELTENYDIVKWYPLCYLTKEDVIILEDLRLRGYKMYDNVLDNIIALKSVLVTLARFHSCSILTEARLHQHSEKKERLDEHYPDHFTEKVFQKVGYGPRWFSAGANLTAGIAERLGYNPGDVHDAYKKLFDIVKPSERYCNDICHGDLWGNNLMFADSLPLPQCILIDFQVTRYAPLVTDLLQFLHLNATRAFRDKYEVDLIELYHSTLEKIVRRNDSKSSVKVPTLEELLKSMNELRMFGLVMATVYLPFVSLDPKVIAENTKDSASYNRFVFEDRLDVTLAYMKENEFYKNRIEEAVIELLEKK